MSVKSISCMDTSAIPVITCQETRSVGKDLITLPNLGVISENKTGSTSIVCLGKVLPPVSAKLVEKTRIGGFL